MKEFIKNIIKIYKLKMALKKAKQKADLLHLQTGKEYHVLLNNGIYQVVDNNVVNVYNKLAKNKPIKSITTIDLRETAIYSTSLKH